MLRLFIILAVLSTGFVLAPDALAKQEPVTIPIIPVLSSCIDFDDGIQCEPGDADTDGYNDWVEEGVGSDPYDAASAPEYALLDEQTGSNTCGDNVDNDLDGRADNGDPGCRLNCKDFGPNQRCKDPDRDRWPTYVEEMYDSDPWDGLSLPETVSIPGTCSDGTDNDLDGNIDGGDSGCGAISDCIDFDQNAPPCLPF